VRGHAFNIGGGPANTTSLRELVRLIGRVHGQEPEVRLDDWRPSDQRYFVSDTRKFERATGWRARTGVGEGVSALYRWLKEGRTRSARDSFPRELPLSA
jgi:CDP-paratose 2-epimerase